MRRALILWVVAAAALLPPAAPAQTSGEQDANKAQARRFFEQVWLGRNYAVADEVFAPEYVLHDLRLKDGLKEKPESQKTTVRYWHDQGEVTGRVDDQIAEADKVVTRWTFRLKLRSWAQQQLAGRESIETQMLHIFRFANGKVVEVWVQRDDYGFEEQMRANRLFYLEGFGFGVLFTLVLIRFLRRTA